MKRLSKDELKRLDEKGRADYFNRRRNFNMTIMLIVQAFLAAILLYIFVFKI